MTDISREEFGRFLDELLKPSEFDDFGPNGLQVEGRAKIQRVAFAVSATAMSIAESVRLEADALIVHHGLFWKFHGSLPIVGPFARRLVPLVRNDINLYAYHLPLDAHLEIGNAAGLARAIGLSEIKPFGEPKGQPMGVRGQLAPARLASDLKRVLSKVLDHPVLLASPAESRLVGSIGIITGGANSQWRLAKQQGLDAYITGEMSEHDWHESQEAGIHMLAGGHYATEVFGVKALLERISQECGLECFFIPSQNPA